VGHTGCAIAGKTGTFDRELRGCRTAEEHENRHERDQPHIGFCYIGVAVIVYTLGHSTLDVAALLALLAAHGIAGIADVRRFPASRRHPHVSAELLAPVLSDVGIRYDWLPALGGRRAPRPDSPHVGWRVAGFRGYADHMESGEFAGGLDHLLGLAAARPTAVMCAEAVQWRCHRRLIADALLVRGVEVQHVLGPTKLEPHTLTEFARVVGTRIVYDAVPQPRLPGV
jgi:uncharacterized protein (DUF488 family)